MLLKKEYYHKMSPLCAHSNCLFKRILVQFQAKHHLVLIELCQEEEKKTVAECLVMMEKELPLAKLVMYHPGSVLLQST